MVAGRVVVSFVVLAGLGALWSALAAWMAWTAAAVVGLGSAVEVG